MSEKVSLDQLARIVIVKLLRHSPKKGIFFFNKIHPKKQKQKQAFFKF